MTRDSLANRLAAWRHARFVGRNAIVAAWQAALDAQTPDFAVLFVHGPAGVGKSALLDELVWHSRQRRREVVRVDGEDLSPDPDVVRDAARATDVRGVLVIDGYEHIAQLDKFIRDHVILDLPAGWLVVIASRTAPRRAWTTDGGWQALTHTVLLANLTPTEAASLLAQRAVPVHDHAVILEFTRCHPLALALVCERYEHDPQFRFSVDDVQDVVATLVDAFLDGCPSHARRRAVELASLVRYTTEDLLASALGCEEDEAAEHFRWLQQRSFMTTADAGLRPNVLARDTIWANLRWKNQRRFDALMTQARQFYLASPTDAAVIGDYLFLHRRLGRIAGLFPETVEKLTLSATESAVQPADLPLIRQIAARHEGEGSAAILAQWGATAPELFTAFRGQEGQLLAFSLCLPLERWLEAGKLPVGDPPSQRALAWVRQGRLRRGERAFLFRAWMGRDDYQGLPIAYLIAAHAVQRYLTTKRLAVALATYAEPAPYGAVYAHAGLQRIDQLDFDVGGTPHRVYSFDWRQQSPRQWLDWIASLESRVVDARPTSHKPKQVGVRLLDRETFGNAVKSALTDYHAAQRLRTNALLNAQLVTRVATADMAIEQRIGALRRGLDAGLEALAADPKTQKLHRALHRRFIVGAPTQELTADALGVSVATVRRHLTAGTDALVNWLWDKEIGP